MPRKWEGLGIRKKLNWATIQQIANIHKGIPLTIPKPRARRPYKPHGHHRSLENKLQRDIIDYLRAIGAVSGRIEVKGLQRFGHYTKDKSLFLGVADILAFYKGQMAFIEVKHGNNILSPAQEIFQQQCACCEVKYIVARSIEDVKAWINSFQSASFFKND